MKPIVICGPTASGKTELALELAKQTDGLIISADSRQVYKQLTIGTTKPQGIYQNNLYTVEGVPYLLVDFIPVTESFNAGNFCQEVHKITSRFPNKTVIFAGGTGMYLHAYFVGMDNLPPGTPQIRTQLKALLEAQGKEGLHNTLAQKDPVSAKQIPAGNVQRTMRALELCLLTGKPASTLKSGHFFQLPNPQQSNWVYLDWDKKLLNDRINIRTQQIFDGMVEETRALLSQGFTPNTPALKTLGYPQALAFLNGSLNKKQAIEEVIIKTRQYAKRQRTWFNRYTQATHIALTCPQDFDVKKLAQAVLACVSGK